MAAETPKNEAQLIDTALRYLQAGIEPRQVMEFVISGAKLFQHKETAVLVSTAIDNAFRDPTAAGAT